MNPTRDKLLRRLRMQALGLVFVLVAAGFVAGSIGIYNKAFTEASVVRMEVAFAGNQMREGADVKLRGVVVGEVTSISSRGDGATLDLALEPERLDVIPADVRARLLPKTLFGERYVALQPPKDSTAGPIEAGDVITQDRSRNAIELERALDSLMPVLRAVEPEKLASTLNAVSTALDGRGKQLGETLAGMSELIGELNPSLPDLEANLAAFTDVAENYSAALPDLLDATSTMTKTSKTLVDKQQGLRALFTKITGASDDLARFFDANSGNIIALTASAQPTLDILEKYAPQYTCLMEQLADQIPAAERAFGKGQEHPNVSRVKIEIIGSRGAYKPGVDEPQYNDKRGPRCYPTVERPGHWPQYPPDGAIRDGSSKPRPPSWPDGSEADDYEDFSGPDGGGGGSAPSGALANSPAEQELIGVLTAEHYGGDPTAVPGWASLLVGPLYRGKEVELE